MGESSKGECCQEDRGTSDEKGQLHCELRGVVERQMSRVVQYTVSGENGAMALVISGIP